MRVKLFWKNDPRGLNPRRLNGLSIGNAQDLEDEINAWLSQSPKVKVVDIKQSASGGSFGPSLWLISVWYEEAA